MILKSLMLTPKIYDDIKAEAIIDPNPKVFKACYLHLIFNNTNEFEVLEKPDRTCTKEEIDADNPPVAAIITGIESTHPLASVTFAQ